MKINVDIDMSTVEQIAIDYIVDQYEALVAQIPFPDTEAELADTLTGYDIVLRDIMKPVEYKALMLKTNAQIAKQTGKVAKPVEKQFKFVIGH